MSKQCIRVDGLQEPDHLLYVSLLVLGLDPVALEHKLKTPVNQVIANVHIYKLVSKRKP